ncbi:MAG TPA: metal ABC transporter permease [Dehalococcoidia bacterium]|nr:metal ABC transporter permease [Dehalococcoidia bacterium]
MFDFISDPLSFEFMQRAMIEVVVVGAICGLVGCFVILRGMAFIGDALAHAVFPGVVISYLADRSIMIGAFIVGGLTAISIGLLARNRRVSEDTAIGVLFAGMFAAGVVIISRNQGFRRDLASLLFGNVLGVSWNEVWFTAGAAAVVALIIFVLLKELQLVAFDPTMARTAGYPVLALDLLLLLLLTATIVISLQAVGNILMLALLITPPATARLLTDRFGRMLALSVCTAALAGLSGLLVSYHADTSAGGTVVLVATGLFLLSFVFAPTHGLLAGFVLRRRGEHHVHHYHPAEEESAPR